jgi:hypothetical protein
MRRPDSGEKPILWGVMEIQMRAKQMFISSSPISSKKLTGREMIHHHKAFFVSTVFDETGWLSQKRRLMVPKRTSPSL